MVEGQTRNRFGYDPSNDSISVLQDIHRGNPKRRNPSLAQPPIPHLVALRPIPTRMRLTVNLDCQPGITAEEVQHIWPRRMLPPELEALRPLAQRLPQDHLR